jgi:hypothetical protein
MIGDAGEQVGEIVLRVETVELGALCRPPDYAERFWKDSPWTRSYGPSSGHSFHFHSA